MSTVDRQPVAERASHGAVSFAAGFLAGLALFLGIGASTGDAAFSALALATLVTVTRTLARPVWTRA